MASQFHLSRVECDDAKELHGLAFPADYWPGDDHTYWIARDTFGSVAGFCSAIYWPDIRCTFLSRAAVTVKAQGYGLQRRMIDARVKWSINEGARLVYTHVKYHNYPSIVNLIKSGFKFCRQDGFEWHHFVLHLAERGPYKSYLRAAIDRSGK